MDADPILIRPFDPLRRGEEGYVLSTWLRDLRDADPSGLPDDLWFPAHRAHATAVLRDPRCAVLVACASDAPDEILGYAAGIPEGPDGPGVLEWVHVRGRSPNLRGRGLALRLLTAAGLLRAHARFRTPDSRDRLRNPLRSRALRRSTYGSTAPRSSS